MFGVDVEIIITGLEEFNRIQVDTHFEFGLCGPMLLGF